MTEPTSREDKINPHSTAIIEIIYGLIKSLPKFSGSGWPVLKIPNIQAADFELPVPRVNIYLDKKLIADTGKGGALKQRSHNKMEIKIDVVTHLDEMNVKSRTIHTWEQLIENVILDNYQIREGGDQFKFIPDDMTFQHMTIAAIDYQPGVDEFERVVDELQFTIIVSYDRKRD